MLLSEAHERRSRSVISISNKASSWRGLWRMAGSWVDVGTVGFPPPCTHSLASLALCDLQPKQL